MSVNDAPPPLMLLQQEAQNHCLTMIPVPIPKAERNRGPDIIEFKSFPTISASAEFFWQLAGDPENVKAFLEAIATIAGSYFAYRASKSIVIKTGGIEVKLTGTNDYQRAVEAVRALQASDKPAVSSSRPKD